MSGDRQTAGADVAVPQVTEVLQGASEYLLAAMATDRKVTPMGFGRRVSKCRRDVARLTERLRKSGDDPWALPVCDALMRSANLLEHYRATDAITDNARG